MSVETLQWRLFGMALAVAVVVGLKLADEGKLEKLLLRELEEDVDIHEQEEDSSDTEEGYGGAAEEEYREPGAAPAAAAAAEADGSSKRAAAARRTEAWLEEERWRARIHAQAAKAARRDAPRLPARPQCSGYLLL
eukprot:TRINITY_DN3842_c0_g2_i1.p1 TRINITY_DN3842_c0_g2~~TRINITY_DN3842_c0_g2_i1.p1  ORF type:complete len:146 (-),score=61.79 TRINITY_DN3842_c0_g2_i1:250-657(-)